MKLDGKHTTTIRKKVPYTTEEISLDELRRESLRVSVIPYTTETIYQAINVLRYSMTSTGVPIYQP